MREDEEQHVTTTEARAASGIKDNLVALVIGVGLLIVLFAIILLIAGM
jgi:CHASE3 domain sensor protein